MTDINGEEISETTGDERQDGAAIIPEESPPEEKKSQLEILQEEFDDLQNKYLRLAADFENFRKRSTKDTEYRVSMAVEGFARDILEVADNVERAIQSEGGTHEGLTQIKKVLESTLERQGIHPYDSIGEPFDPAMHEAIAYVPSDKNEGLVCDEVCRGYRIDEKVFRCAKVAVSRGKSDDSPSTE